jgi:hypothetical protein
MTLGVTAANQLPMAEAASASGGAKKVVRIFVNGGMSHVDSFDPKPETSEVMGDTKPIRTNTGEQIGEHFPELAKRMDKMALVRSMVSPEGDHERGRYLIQTSYKMIGTIRHPFFGAWMQKLNGKMNDELPPCVCINGTSLGGGYLGTSYDPFNVKNPSDALRGLVMKDPTSTHSKELLKLMADVRIDFHKKFRFKNTDAYKNYYNDSIRLMQSKDLSAFDLKLEEKASAEKYNIPHGNSFLLARRLIEANVQYVGINIGGNWDNHQDLWETDTFPTNGRNLDKAVATFLDDMHQKGLLKDTIVSLNTEFGRTPKINRDKGRDHHRKAYSGLMFGAGVKGGVVYGKTNERAESVVENPVAPSDFNATIAHLAGIKLEKEIYSPDNRPFTVAREGKPVKGIMA